MAIDTYETLELLEVIRVQKSLPAFWLQFFPNQVNFQTDKIAFDKITDNYKKLAPFVAPNVQGRVQSKDGYNTVSYAPGYIKPKDIVDPNTDLVRRAGESLVSGTMSVDERFNAVLAELLASQKIKIENRWEWMAAQVVQTGKVIIEGTDYPKVTVDFLRDASLTTVLSGTARWGQSAQNPLGDIQASRKNVSDLCGAVVQDVIFGASAWALFSDYILANKLNLINSQIRGSNSTLSLFVDGFEGVEYAGDIAGSNGAMFRCWIYSAKYENEAGSMVDMLDTNTVVGISRSFDGVRCFAAIKDRKANFMSTPMFPKVWEQDDPSGTFVMTQSAPLMVPRQVNATFSIKVA